MIVPVLRSSSVAAPCSTTGSKKNREVDPWKILPLVNPAQVSDTTTGFNGISAISPYAIDHKS